MPLILDPEATFEVVLDYDKKKDKKVRPVFVFKYLSARQWKKLAEIHDNFIEWSKIGTDSILNHTFEGLRMVMVDWRNMKTAKGESIEFDMEKLEDMLTPSEADELLIAAVQQAPSVEDKKKLDLPSDSSTEQSARPAKESQTAKEK